MQDSLEERIIHTEWKPPKAPYFTQWDDLTLFLISHNPESFSHLQYFTSLSEEQRSQQPVGETSDRDADQMHSREQAGPRGRGVEDLPLPLQHHTDAARGGEWMLRVASRDVFFSQPAVGGSRRNYLNT